QKTQGKVVRKPCAQNYGVHHAVGAMFAAEPAYWAQANGVRSWGSTWRQIPHPWAIEGVK
ncbi:MAG: hypothetical protein ACLPJY_11185, partial [Rhodomicrobium sp.]